MSRDTQTIDRISPGVVDVLNTVAGNSSDMVSGCLRVLASMDAKAALDLANRIADEENEADFDLSRPQLELLGLAFLHSIIIAERSCSPKVKRA